MYKSSTKSKQQFQNPLNILGDAIDTLSQKISHTKSGVSINFDWPAIYCGRCASSKIIITDNLLYCNSCKQVLLCTHPITNPPINLFKEYH